MSGGVVMGGGSTERGGGAEKGCKTRCSRRLWVLFGMLALVFLTSLFFSVSLRGGVSLNYLEPPGWEEARRVKLVPNYVGAHRLSMSDGPLQKTCACPRCVGDPGVSDWFDENYDPDISPVWTKDNIQLPSDVYYWWVVSKSIQCFPFNYQGSFTHMYVLMGSNSLVHTGILCQPHEALVCNNTSDISF